MRTGVAVDVDVGVEAGVGTAVGTGTGTGVAVGVVARVGTAVGAVVGTGNAAGVGVGAAVGDGVGAVVGVGVDVGGGVGVGVGVGVETDATGAGTGVGCCWQPTTNNSNTTIKIIGVGLINLFINITSLIIRLYKLLPIVLISNGPDSVNILAFFLHIAVSLRSTPAIFGCYLSLSVFRWLSCYTCL